MRRRFVVHGRVQGVNFRASAAAEARRLGLTGRVWNSSGGSVECVAEGDESALASFRDWLGRGPRMARVERVEETPLAGEPTYREFEIARE